MNTRTRSGKSVGRKRAYSPVPVTPRVKNTHIPTKRKSDKSATAPSPRANSGTKGRKSNNLEPVEVVPAPEENNLQRELLAEIKALRSENAGLRERLDKVEQAQSVPQTSMDPDWREYASVHEEQSPVPQVETLQHDSTLLSGPSVGLISSPIPVGLHLKPNIRSLIFENKYVNFSLLLENQEPTTQDLRLEPTDDGSQRLVIGAPSSKQKPISWLDWCSAWNTFIALLCDFRGDPALPAQLAKHFQTVQNLFRKNADWRRYDEQFRQLIEKGLVQWGQVHQELIIESRLQADIGKQPARRPLQFSPTGMPMGLCIRYNKFNTCQFSHLCKFSHRCAKCSGPHSALFCVRDANRPFRGFPAGPSNRGGGRSFQNFPRAANTFRPNMLPTSRAPKFGSSLVRNK